MNREQLARKCALIEKAGGSVREYLRSCGCISPWGTWFRLQREELGRKKCQITDGKGGAEMRKITLADKKKAVEIAISGGNPLPYLKECGSKNPSAAWYAIKQTLKETDPETYALLPDLRKKDESKEEETMNEIHMDAEPEIMPVDNRGEPVKIPQVVLTINSEDLTREIDETPHVSPITKTVNYGWFETLSIRDQENGNVFSYDPKCGVMEWRTEAGDEVIMHPDHWRDLAEKLPQVLQILGI